eukprot:TRINITY_DN902_c0_g1_i10.p1 TRINITY_DN902_c0_g1~~TRINITY_DN902_c0_g1_i10.p1  ORF type:complete len:216 (+),score=35.29 TRINITY_DN902_c0_g1_i10:519-1166(+)
MVLYDICFCGYFLLVFFMIVWTVIGHIWLEDSSKCVPKADQLVSMANTNLTVMWVFLGGGLTIALIAIFIYACDEGSCNMNDILRCWCLCCTCCLVDTGKNRKNKKQDYEQQRSIYTVERKTWLGSAKRMLGFEQRNPLIKSPRDQHHGAPMSYAPAPQIMIQPAQPPPPPPEQNVYGGQPNYQQGNAPMYPQFNNYAPPPPPGYQNYPPPRNSS